MMLMVVVDVFR